MSATSTEAESHSARVAPIETFATTQVVASCDPHDGTWISVEISTPGESVDPEAIGLRITTRFAPGSDDARETRTLDLRAADFVCLRDTLDAAIAAARGQGIIS